MRGISKLGEGRLFAGLFLAILDFLHLCLSGAYEFSLVKTIVDGVPAAVMCTTLGTSSLGKLDRVRIDRRLKRALSFVLEIRLKV